MDNVNTTSQTELDILSFINTAYQINNYSLRQIFLLLTRNFFSNYNNFAPAGIKLPDSFTKYTYSDKIVDPDSNYKSNINIQLTNSFADSPDKIFYNSTAYPLNIYVNVGDTSFAPSGAVDDYVKNIPDGYQQAALANTQVTISHQATTYDDCAILSQLTSSFYISFRNPIRDQLHAMKFNVKGVTAPKIINSEDGSNAKKIYRSDLIMELIYETDWKINPESVMIRKFTLKLDPKI